MSNAVFPTLPGRTYPAVRSVLPPPVTVRTTPSQREYRARDALLPRYRYVVPYEWLRTRASSPELQTLVGFYNTHGGPFDSWLYSDPDDNTALLQPFGVGDGTTTQFQLLRAFGGFAEGVDAINGTPLVYADGSPVGSITTTAGSGRITIGTAPASGAVLTWSGGFYRRCRFMGAQLDTERFMAGLFSAKRVEFISSKT